MECEQLGETKWWGGVCKGWLNPLLGNYGLGLEIWTFSHVEALGDEGRYFAGAARNLFFLRELTGSPMALDSSFSSGG